MLARWFLSFLICVSAGLAADQGLISLVMPDAVSLAGVNAAQVRTSPLGQFLLARVPANEPQLEALLAATGFDPRRDIQEILVASPQPLQPGAHPPGGLVLVRGNFDVSRITQAALSHNATLTQYDGVPVLSGPRGKGSVAFPDSTLAIAGESDVVRAALDRRSSPAPLNGKLASAAQTLSAANDVWAVTEGPLLPARGAGKMQLFSKVQQSTCGVKFGADVVAAAEATLPSDQDAAALAQALQLLARFGDVYIKDIYIKSALLKNLKITASGDVTQATLAIPEALIEQLFTAAMPHLPQP